MKIALAQINTQIGNFTFNVEKVLEAIQKAKRKKAELVIFPELTLTGYPPKDLLEKPHFIEANLKALKTVAKQCHGIAALVGYVEPNPEKTGRALFNSAALLFKGKVVANQRKRLLPSYDVFDETRYFEPGSASQVVKLGKYRLGLTICEDIWNDERFLGRRLYAADPVEDLSDQKLDLLLNISASPYSMGKGKVRKDLLVQTVKRLQVPMIYLNLVGGNDDLIFDGGSLVFNEKGNLAVALKRFEEDFVIVDTDHLSSQVFSQEEEIELVREALVLGIRDYMKKCGFQKVALGLSGGMDSCLVAILAAEACGAKNVLGVSLPSPYSSKGSLQDAQALAKRLGIHYQVIPIGDIYQSYQDTLNLKPVRGKVDIALQNIQARIRGNILMALSNREGYLLLSTGNKSEMGVGYCTLYGDMAGGLAAISDLPKILVYRLSRYLNKIHRAIPESVFIKAPSAELAPNQKDQDDLPPYEVLDEILKRAIEENQSASQILSAGFDRKVLQKALLRVDRNEYKRHQAPPGLRITSKAFGYGRRLPITHAFREF